jgi:23S rRNA (cytidine2498-2'-O)-methyltransferase
VLLTCQAGFEPLLARELAELHGARVAEQGPGWLRVESDAGASGGAAAAPTPVDELAFAHLRLIAPVELRGDSVNALASSVADFFLASLRGERLEAPWPLWWFGPAEMVGLGRRVAAVEAAFVELVRKKLARVAKLAAPGLPRAPGVGPARGLFVFFADFGRVFVARDAWINGPRRMADDPLAPSRSYLKVEEAYVVLGREPRAGESVCDLGAAPGGWSYSAAKRGARVIAVDNGPLKAGALDHSRITHRREDAFRFTPASAEATAFDWLFCDLVEEPHHVVRDILMPWLERRWCRYFVVNLKFGRVDPIALLRELGAANSPIAAAGRGVRIRHLYHDREEFTLMGEVRT